MLSKRLWCCFRAYYLENQAYAWPCAASVIDLLECPSSTPNITAQSGSFSPSADGAPYDFVSRCFYPWTGIDEDPVTGSAHCILAGYWEQQLGRPSLFTRQCSPRGGEVHVDVDKAKGRVVIKGRAAVVSVGKLLL